MGKNQEKKRAKTLVKMERTKYYTKYICNGTILLYLHLDKMNEALDEKANNETN